MSDATPPHLSVIVPVRNEGRHIEACLRSILDDEPPDRLEVIVVDGQSDDGTAELVRTMAETDDRVRLIENPERFVPHAMNAGIKAARGRYIGRVDGHSRIESGYFAGCLARLESGRYGCVGGIVINEGEPGMGRAIAAAMSSPLAVGASSFRTGVAREKEVDTLAFGVYPKEVFDRIGGFDEDLVRNQDDELNLRLTSAGERILLVPELRVRYQVRSSMAALGRQYFQYGYWKLRVMRKHGGIAAVRHVVPSAFLIGLALLGLLSVWSRAAGLALVGVAGVYGIALLAEGVRMAVSRGAPALGTTAAIAVMHFSYGWGLLSAVVDSILNPGAKSSARHTRLSR